MFFGNILGSIIVNSSLIVGLTAVINPVNFADLNSYVIPTIAFILVFLVFWFFIKSKHRLDRWEAGLLILLYVAFIVSELL